MWSLYDRRAEPFAAVSRSVSIDSPCAVETSPRKWVLEGSLVWLRVRLPNAMRAIQVAPFCARQRGEGTRVESGFRVAGKDSLLSSFFFVS